MIVIVLIITITNTVELVFLVYNTLVLELTIRQKYFIKEVIKTLLYLKKTEIIIFIINLVFSYDILVTYIKQVNLMLVGFIANVMIFFVKFNP